MNTNVSGPVLGDHWSLDHAILSIWGSRFCEVNKWSYVPQLVIDTNTVQIQNLFLNHWITCFPSANAYLNNFQEAGKFKRMETCMPICLKTFFFNVNFHSKPLIFKRLSCRYFRKNINFTQLLPSLWFVWKLE